VHLLNLNNTPHPPHQQHLPHNNISEILSLKTNVSLDGKTNDDNDDYNDDVKMMLYAFFLPPLTTMNFKVRYNNGEMYLYVD